MESEGLGWMRMSERVKVCGSVSRGLHVLACVYVCARMHACMRENEDGGLECMCDSVSRGPAFVLACIHMWLEDSVAFSMYLGFSICRLCCYCCVSMETLSPIAAPRTQHQSLCL